MLSKTWRIILLAIIVGFSLWTTAYSNWVILVAAVILLVFEVSCKGCDMCRKNVMSAPVRASRPRTSRTSKRRRR